MRAALRRAFDLVVGLKLLDFSFGCRGLFLPRTYRLTHRIIESYMIQVWARDIHIVLQKIQMKLILLCVWAERAVLVSAKTALKFNNEISIGYQVYNSMYVAGYKLEKWKK